MLTETLLIFLTSIASFNHADIKTADTSVKTKTKINTSVRDEIKVTQIQRGGWDHN